MTSRTWMCMLTHTYTHKLALACTLRSASVSPRRPGSAAPRFMSQWKSNKSPEDKRRQQERKEEVFQRYQVRRHHDDQPDYRYSQPSAKGPQVVLVSLCRTTATLNCLQKNHRVVLAHVSVMFVISSSGGRSKSYGPSGGRVAGMGTSTHAGNGRPGMHCHQHKALQFSLLGWAWGRYRRMCWCIAISTRLCSLTCLGGHGADTDAHVGADAGCL
eukprot:1155746-Pelagomonas_calceolata.AAC.9